jgi:chemotaxis protein MotB
MKRLQPHARENHERWLVSYADFITLLFAFFVVMFASTQADKRKAKAVSDSVREALEHGQFSSTISVVLGRGKHDARKAPAFPEPAKKEEEARLPKPQNPDPNPDLRKSLATLQQGLAKELTAGKVEVRLLPRGLVISLREAAFFASGDDRLAAGGLPIVEKIASVIKTVPNPIRLEGHTDSVPIHNPRFRSNWELSTARSIAMLEILADRFQIERSRMAVAGYAENAPADTNETAEGRAHNRRVDVVLLTLEGQRTEPGAAPPPAAREANPPEEKKDK